MGSWILTIGGVVLGLALMLWLVLVVALRTGNATILGAIRRSNRRFSNPRVMRTAGQAGDSRSVIRHVGRVSGADYATPIGVHEAEGGFLVTLPYGTTPDWLKNVRTARTAVLLHQGRVIPVYDPELVPTRELVDALPRQARFLQWLYGIDLYLRLKSAEDMVGEPTLRSLQRHD